MGLFSVIFHYVNIISHLFFISVHKHQKVFLFLATLTVSNMAAFVLRVIFESPMCELEKIVYQRLTAGPQQHFRKSPSEHNEPQRYSPKPNDASFEREEDLENNTNRAALEIINSAERLSTSDQNLKATTNLTSAVHPEQGIRKTQHLEREHHLQRLVKAQYLVKEQLVEKAQHRENEQHLEKTHQHRDKAQRVEKTQHREKEQHLENAHFAQLLEKARILENSPIPEKDRILERAQHLETIGGIETADEFKTEDKLREPKEREIVVNSETIVGPHAEESPVDFVNTKECAANETVKNLKTTLNREQSESEKSKSKINDALANVATSSDPDIYSSLLYLDLPNTKFNASNGHDPSNEIYMYRL